MLERLPHSVLEVDARRLVRSDRSHDTSHLGLSVGLQIGGLLEEAFEVDSVAIYAHFYKGKFRQQLALLFLSKPGVEPERDRRAVVDDGREHAVEDGRVGSAEGYAAIVGRRGTRALKALNLLRHGIIVKETQIIGN